MTNTADALGLLLQKHCCSPSCSYTSWCCAGCGKSNAHTAAKS